MENALSIYIIKICCSSSQRDFGMPIYECDSVPW